MSTAARKIITGKVVEGRTNKSRVQIWRDVKAGLFPAPVEIGPNRIGWFEDEVEAWLESRPRRTYGAPPPDGKPADVLPDQSPRKANLQSGLMKDTSSVGDLREISTLHSRRPPGPHRVEGIDKRTNTHPVNSTSEARLLESQDAH